MSHSKKEGWWHLHTHSGVGVRPTLQQEAETLGMSASGVEAVKEGWPALTILHCG